MEAQTDRGFFLDHKELRSHEWPLFLIELHFVLWERPWSWAVTGLRGKPRVPLAKLLLDLQLTAALRALGLKDLPLHWGKRGISLMKFLEQLGEDSAGEERN